MIKNTLRPSGRAADEMRPISFIRNYTRYAEGSVLTCFGDTKVLCTASVSETLPNFLRNGDRGWVTAEYGMLPRSTHTRIERESTKGKQQGRTIEIQRLIGRSLRAAVDLQALGPRNIIVDCDVIQADGGTRTAAISGAWIALADALNHLHSAGIISQNPLKRGVAAVSVGIYQQTPVLDLEYAEDSQADMDMNIVMDDTGSFIELQGTAEAAAFTTEELNSLLTLAKKGVQEIIATQRSLF